MPLALALGLPFKRSGSAAGSSNVGDQFVPIGARSRGLPGTANISSGAFNSFNGQNVFWNLAGTAISAMKVGWVDFDLLATGLAAKAAGAVFQNFSAGLNVQQVSQGDFLFDGGAATTTLNAPASAASFSLKLSDEKAVTLAAANSFAIRMFGSMAVGTDFYLNDYQGGALANGTRIVSAPATIGGSAITGFTEGLTRANALADGTAGNANPSHTGIGWFSPTVVLGKVNNPTKSIALWGDSIAQGQSGDYLDAYSNLGYAPRTWQNTIPWINLSRGTIQAAFFNTAANRDAMLQIIAPSVMYITDFICALGRNDMAGSSDAATIKTDVDFICAPQKVLGRACWVTTIPPWTSSSDNWTTVAGQTLVSAPKEAIRNTYNSDRKANFVAQGYRGVIDIAVPVESALTPGNWDILCPPLTLVTDITSTGQTGNITVGSTAAITAAGFTQVQIFIDSERMQCSVLDGTRLAILNTGRAQAGTTAALHSPGALIHVPLTNDGIHPNFNGHEKIRVAGTVAISKFGR